MASNQEFGPQWQDPYARKPGMSTSSKVLLGLGIGCGVMAVLCCGGVMLSGVFFAKYMEKAVSEDPAVIRQVTSQIVTIDIPPELQPTASIDMKVPFTGQSFMTWAVFADKSSQSVLTIAQFGEMFQGNEMQMRVQLEQSLREQGLTKDQQLGTRESHQKTIQVRGQPAVFTFVTGKENNTGKKRLEVIGSFKGANGTVMLMLFADDAKLNEDRVIEMLESIK